MHRLIGNRQTCILWNQVEPSSWLYQNWWSCIFDYSRCSTFAFTAVVVPAQVESTLRSSEGQIARAAHRMRSECCDRVVFCRNDPLPETSPSLAGWWVAFDLVNQFLVWLWCACNLLSDLMFSLTFEATFYASTHGCFGTRNSYVSRSCYAGLKSLIKWTIEHLKFCFRRELAVCAFDSDRELECLALTRCDALPIPNSLSFCALLDLQRMEVVHIFRVDRLANQVANARLSHVGFTVANLMPASPCLLLIKGQIIAGWHHHSLRITWPIVN